MGSPSFVELLWNCLSQNHAKKWCVSLKKKNKCWRFKKNYIFFPSPLPPWTREKTKQNQNLPETVFLPSVTRTVVEVFLCLCLCLKTRRKTEESFSNRVVTKHCFFSLLMDVKYLEGVMDKKKALHYLLFFWLSFV